ncbi:MAG: right-handed parallel beta-helix repeat-containing protein [Sinimarinibacterium sp.]|jgi:poly(beta-D-mannuronate) C5 epimerase
MGLCVFAMGAFAVGRAQPAGLRAAEPMWRGADALGVAAIVCIVALASPPAAADSIVRPRNYVVREAALTDLRRAEPAAPDLRPYTAAAVTARMPKARPARVQVQRMVTLEALGEFVSGTHKGRLAEWAARQTRNPVAIVIEGGRASLPELSRLLDKSQLSEAAPGVYLLRLPLLIQPGATLVIDKRVRELRLSQEHGAFLVNDGQLFVMDSRITGWRERDDAPATFRRGDEFRPFLVSWGGAELYIVNSVVASLGYSASKGYGVSVSQYSPGRQAHLRRPSPVAWVLNSEFVDNWFGFYCFEADGLVVIGNRYRDNIVYGVDPHDRSNKLIIADNDISGTRKKHGLIISREVNDSWIFRNRIHGNALSGIVIDRNSVHNTLLHNTVYGNGSDGITVYESSDNLLWGNSTIGNGKHGIRVRNSVRVGLYENSSLANQLSGIYGHVKDLSGTDRDVRLDPFEPNVSMVVVGGKLSHNRAGPVSIDRPLSLELFDVELLAPTGDDGIRLRGVLGDHQETVLDLLMRKKVPVMVEPALATKQES